MLKAGRPVVVIVVIKTFAIIVNFTMGLSYLVVARIAIVVGSSSIVKPSSVIID